MLYFVKFVYDWGWVVVVSGMTELKLRHSIYIGSWAALDMLEIKLVDCAKQIYERNTLQNHEKSYTNNYFTICQKYLVP